MNGVFFNDLKTCEPGLKVLRGYLAIASDATVTTADCRGRGITWSKEGTGLYRATFSSDMKSLAAPSGGIGPLVMFSEIKPTAVARRFEIVDQDIATNGYVTFRTVNDSSAAADTGTAMGLDVVFWMKDTTVA